MYQSGRILSLVLALGAAILGSRGVMAQTGGGEATSPPEIIKLIRSANSRERYEALAHSKKCAPAWALKRSGSGIIWRLAEPRPPCLASIH